MRYEADHADKFSEEERYKLVRHIVYLMKKSGKITTECYGLDNLPKSGGYVMYPNHQGKYDALGIIITHKEPCSLVMDAQKSHTILVGEFVDLCQGKRLKKDDVRQALRIINDVSADLKKGKKYILFPEGGYEFNNRNKVCDFKAGSFKCAVKAKAPIVPVALIDSYKVFNSFYLGKITTQVRYLKPLYYEDYKGMKTQEIASLVKRRIEDEIFHVLAKSDLA
jgi:1-acyl-sn-glycerol-3-phosphate acyltransferase